MGTRHCFFRVKDFLSIPKVYRFNWELHITAMSLQHEQATPHSAYYSSSSSTENEYTVQ